MSQQAKKPKLSEASANTVDRWAVQCGRCFKWRIVSSQEEFEELRSKILEDPFLCEKKRSVSCDDSPDIEYNSSRTWVIDKPNLAKTPAGFTRKLLLRKDHSKMDVHYLSPTGKKLRSVVDVGQFLQDSPNFNHLTVSDFSFTAPKVMPDTIPDHIERKHSAGRSLVLG